MPYPKISYALLFVGCVLLFCTFLYSSECNSSTNLYRVTVASQEDADKLSGLDIDAFMKVSDGYLILADQEVTFLLSKLGLTYQLICSDVNRNNLLTFTEHSPDNIDNFPLIFNENGLRLYHVEPDEIKMAQREFHLRPLQIEHLGVRYSEPLSLDADQSTDIELDSLVSLVRQDSLESYLFHMDVYDNRWWGTTGNTMCRIWLYNKLLDCGYDSVYLDEFAGYGTTGQYAIGKNVVAVKPGTTYPEIHIVIGGHFDSGGNEYGHSPGADDNGSGTGGVLEIARIMADIDTRLTYVFILFDAEEAWMVGSVHYANQAAAKDQKIAYMMNMDMIGHEENDTEAYLHYYLNDAYAQLWTQLAATIPGIGITGHVTDYWGLVSDQGPFAEAGYDVIFVQEYEFSTHYHMESDSAVYLNFDYMTRMVQASMATAYVTDQQFEPEYELHITAADEFPELLYPQRKTPVQIYVREYGGAQILPGGVLLRYSVDGSEESTLTMDALGDDLYSGNLPELDCSDGITYNFSAEDDSLGVVYYPSPNETFLAGVGSGMYTIFEDYFDTDLGWEVETNTFHGEWERYESGNDYDGNGYNYTTSTGMTTLMDGTTSLKSPPLDINDNSGTIEYARWFAYIMEPEPGQQADTFKVMISANGYSWIPVEIFEPGISRDWEVREFQVSEFLSSPQTIWLRFDATEYGGDTFIRGAVDGVKVNGLSSDLRIVTEEIPNWTAGHPFSFQLEAAVCNYDSLTWNDRFGQLDGTGLTLSSGGLLSGVPVRIGPVVFRAEVTDQSGGYYESILNFLVYDSLKIITNSIPTATIDEIYACQLHSSGGTGDKSWSDRDGDLSESSILLSPDGLLSGTPPAEGDYPFVALVTDEVGAIDEVQFTLHIIGQYICGDANADGQPNVGDAVFLISYIFKGGPAPSPDEAGDANCDGQVNVGDAVYLIAYVFSGGDEPCCP
jgi:hypothetical protein